MSLRAGLLALLLAGGAFGLPGGLPVGGPSGLRAETIAQSAAEATGPQVAVQTDLEGARDLARRALASGRPDLAASIARQILAAYPQDPGAHMLLAAALTRVGAPDQAAPVARAGFRLAEKGPARFEAAYLTAEAMALSGRPWAAKYWLRRAAPHAPGAAHSQVLEQAYRTVSSQSRLGFSVALFGGPSDNVNGGSLHDTFWFHGIPIPITEALPGQVWGAALRGGYRLDERTELSFGWTHREVVLGSRARAIDPQARGRDFRQDQLTLGLSHVRLLGGGESALFFGAQIGRRWSGGEVSAHLGRASLGWRQMAGGDWLWGAGLSLETVDIPDRPVADSVTGRLTLSARREATRFGGVEIEIGAVDVDSEAAGIAWRGPSLSLGWRPEIESRHLGLSLALAAERRDYWRSTGYGPDLWAGLSVTAELKSMDIMGFSPTLTLTAERTRSDLVVRDAGALGLAFGVSSRF
ncbi:tetratricopeptide repeat protein [Pseudogemmobacter sonorensis]|uniref:tetratricopeptide repeat protein n=1 Tax=Pseudogemmobacter sonorensis TaxID=2989681 RepID=UPI0036BC384A